MAQVDVDIAPNNTQSGNNPIACNSGTWNGKICYTEKINISDPSTLLDASVNAAGTPGTNALAVQGTLAGGLLATQGPGVNSTGNGQFVAVSDSSAVISAPAAATTTLITGVAGKSIRVTGIDWISNGNGTVTFAHGAGNTPLTGAYPVTPQDGVSRSGYGPIWTLPSGDSLTVITTTTAAIYGSVSYTLY